MTTSISIDSHGTAIPAELVTSAAVPFTGAAVIVVHGSDGMTEPWAALIRDYAAELSAKGYAVIIPDYFTKTNTVPGLHVFGEIQANIGSWTEAVSDAAIYSRMLPGMPVSRVGMLGFSLGGHICLRLRESVHALVEFFAPELREAGGIGSMGAASPHVQIHHGLADLLVPFSDTEAIVNVLKLEGSVPEVFSYEGAGHGFAGADPNNATARRSSKNRTLAFFGSAL